MTCKRLDGLMTGLSRGTNIMDLVPTSTYALLSRSTTIMDLVLVSISRYNYNGLSTSFKLTMIR